MQNRASVVLSIAVFLAGVAVVSTPALAQGRGGGGGRGCGAPRVAPNLPPAGPIPRTADCKPNLEGVFSGMGSGLTHTVILEDHTSGFGIRGADIDKQGVVWASLASGHLASFDRRKCKGPLNGPKATGDHCPEGWAFHQYPGPGFQGI